MLLPRCGSVCLSITVRVVFCFGIRTVDAVDHGLLRKSRDGVADRTILGIPWWCEMFSHASCGASGSVPLIATIELHHTDECDGAMQGVIEADRVHIPRQPTHDVSRSPLTLSLFAIPSYSFTDSFTFYPFTSNHACRSTKPQSGAGTSHTQAEKIGTEPPLVFYGYQMPRLLSDYDCL
jgi:hypothetical protein